MPCAWLRKKTTTEIGKQNESIFSELLKIKKTMCLEKMFAWLVSWALIEALMQLSLLMLYVGWEAV